MDRYELAFDDVKRPRTRVLWLKRIGKGLLMAAIILVVGQSWHHYQATKKLQEALTELDAVDPGWRLSEIEAAREQVPEEENSGRIVIAASQLLPRGWPPREFGELFAHQAQDEKLDTEDLARLKQELEAVRPALEKARKLTPMHRGRYSITYQPLVYETLLLDQSNVRRIAYLLTCDALLHEQRQDLKAALNSCRGSLNAARSLGDEPIALSQLIRNVCVMNCCTALERVLAQGEPPPDDLVSLQHSLGKEDDFPDLVIVARGERAALHATFDAVESGDVPFSKLEGTGPSWKDHVYGWFSREKFREAHPTMLAAMSRFVALAQLPMQEQAAAQGQLDQELRNLKQSNPLAVLFIPAINNVSESSRRKHVYLRCMIVSLAAERYRQKYKTWPDSLDKLCPNFLAAVPRDPFDGQALRYGRFEKGVMIYSVSADGADDGGNLDPAHPNQPGVDIGYRLWDVAKRHQPPRPKPPAIPEHR